MMSSTLLNAAHCSHFSPHLFAEEFSELFAQSVHRESLAVEKRSCTTALAAISPTLSVFCRTWLMGQGKSLGVQPKISDQ